MVYFRKFSVKMSTRSGKRIHNKSIEDIAQIESEPLLKVGRKTRSKRVVDNSENQEALIKTKKRRNYVSYPADEEVTGSNNIEDENSVKPGRVLRTLKEQNVASDEVAPSTAKKQVRQTRRTKKFSETATEEASEAPHHEEEIEVVPITNGKSKCKKNKKKTKKAIEQTDILDKENDVKEAKKKKNRRKKHSKSNSSIERVEEIGKIKKNDGNMSTDSFHSAAGSPIKININGILSPQDKSSPLHVNKADNSVVNDSGLRSKNKRRLSLKNKSFDSHSPERVAMDVDTPINTTFDKEPEIVEESKMKSSVKNTTFDSDLKSQVTEKLNITFEKEPANEIPANKKKRKSNLMDKSIENADIATKTSDLVNSDIKKKPNGILNTTFEKDEVIKETDARKLRKSSIKEPINDILPLNSLQSSKTLIGKAKKSSSPRKSLVVSKETSPLNGTFEISPKPDSTKPKSLNTTFDKPKLDSTFDKIDTHPKSDSKSSLISSDVSEASSNITLDKSDDLSKISITDDDSKTENILNQTPVLIESSMEASTLENSLKENKTPELHVKKTPEAKLETAPLKREGTFTKDEPEVSLSPKKTPTKRQTLPTAGHTPYHSNGKRSTKKSVLNLTHSIEKPAVRSSLAEVPRTTRVMFCSPVNNPVTVMQRKSKIIKSNLKGSNKSFVYEENAEPVRAGRKRSFTQCEESEARAKRSRLAESRPERAARPRTASAMAKFTTAVTPQKPSTPLKPKSGTKLPNFAALHARRFERMESLDECQQRRARRAKHLLEPTGSLTVLERSSPRVTLEPAKSKETPPKPTTPAKPPFKLPTLDTLQKGYTRFGFKMNCEVNPFSVPSKTADKQPKEVTAKVFSGLRREVSQPSLAGATSLRRAAAKQTIMREKSFTQAEKIDEKRKECRTVIKGVRTNRRFELQMKSRNING